MPSAQQYAPLQHRQRQLTSEPPVDQTTPKQAGDTNG